MVTFFQAGDAFSTILLDIIHLETRLALAVLTASYDGMYEGRSINKLQNSVILLVYQI